MGDILLVLSVIVMIIAPITGLVMWIYGRVKNKKNIRHQGFLILMISLLFFFMIVFTFGASLFYVWLMNN